MALDPQAVLPTQVLERALRVAFFGTPALAVPTLDVLALGLEGVELVAVVAQPDKPSGRGRSLRPPPVALRAQELGLPLYQPRKLRSGEFPGTMEGWDLDVAVVIAYGRILPTRLLEAPRFGCINVHASLLPAYRGAGPIQWAILKGEDETGVTTMWMEEGLDTGPILQTRHTPIGTGETAGELGKRLAGLGAELLADTLRSLAAGTLVARPQPEEGISHAPLLSKDDGRLDWSRGAAALAAQVRGLHPWPGTFCGYGDSQLKVLSAQAEAMSEDEARAASASPGQVLSADDRGIRVRCGEGALVLTRVQPPGRKALDAADFLRGYSLGPGDDLCLPARLEQ